MSLSAAELAQSIGGSGSNIRSRTAIRRSGKHIGHHRSARHIRASSLNISGRSIGGRSSSRIVSGKHIRDRLGLHQAQAQAVVVVRGRVVEAGLRYHVKLVHVGVGCSTRRVHVDLILRNDVRNEQDNIEGDRAITQTNVRTIAMQREVFRAQELGTNQS